MHLYLRQAHETIFPPKDNPHGPLPPILLLWTIVTGLVDAYSYLELSRVFVANMTGNVVFLGFSLAGAPGFLWWASVLAILAFMVGANLGGRIQRGNSGQHRAAHLAAGAATQMALVIVAVIVALLLPPADHILGLVILVVILSVAMGLQNSTARALGVPDLTTTVLTLTITGLAGDGSAQEGKKNNVGRRILSIFCMALGAFIGGLLVQAEKGAYTLIVAALLIAVIVWRAAHHRENTASWTNPK